MTTPPVPPAAAAPDKARSGSMKPTLCALMELVPLVGKPLGKLCDAGAWGVLGGIAGAIMLLVVYPLLLPILAAWLINRGLLGDWHAPYADQVRRAFRVEELANTMAGIGNQRLDYFQVIDVARSSNEPQSISFSVQRRQKIILRKEAMTLQSVATSVCGAPLSLTKPGLPILDVQVGNVSIGTFRYGPQEDVIEFTQSRWEKLRDESIDGRLMLRLVPVNELMVPGCADLLVHLRMTIEVFKDLVAGPAPAASSAS